MSKTNKKTQTPKTPSLSEAFAKAVESVLSIKCVDGSATAAETVAKELKKNKQAKQFGISNFLLLKLMVSQSVAEGSVPGYASMKGRPPSGGIYNVAQREAWNAQVDAEEAK